MVFLTYYIIIHGHTQTQLRSCLVVEVPTILQNDLNLYQHCVHRMNFDDATKCAVGTEAIGSSLIDFCMGL
jgi:hypothetical protein